MSFSPAKLPQALSPTMRRRRAGVEHLEFRHMLASSEDLVQLVAHYQSFDGYQANDLTVAQAQNAPQALADYTANNLSLRFDSLPIPDKLDFQSSALIPPVRSGQEFASHSQDQARPSTLLARQFDEVVAELAESAPGLDQVARAVAAHLPQSQQLDHIQFDLAVGDSNADGFDEFAVVATEERQASIFLFESQDHQVLNGQVVDLALTAPPELNSLLTPAPPLSVAFGDENGDGYDELVVGLPQLSSVTELHSGGAFIASGSSEGTNLAEARVITPQLLGFPAQAQGHFGAALAFADLNHDGADELAIGAPGERSNGVERAGAVYVVPGHLREGQYSPRAQRLTALDLELPIDSHSVGTKIQVDASDKRGRFNRLIVYASHSPVEGDNPGFGVIDSLATAAPTPEAPLVSTPVAWSQIEPHTVLLTASSVQQAIDSGKGSLVPGSPSTMLFAITSSIRIPESQPFSSELGIAQSKRELGTLISVGSLADSEVVSTDKKLRKADHRPVDDSLNVSYLLEAEPHERDKEQAVQQDLVRLFAALSAFSAAAVKTRQDEQAVSESTIMDLIQQRNPAALGYMYVQYGGQLVQFLQQRYRRLNSHDYEDVMVDTLLRVFQNFDSSKGQSILPYAIRIAVNGCNDLFRLKQKESLLASEFLGLVEQPESPAPPEDLRRLIEQTAAEILSAGEQRAFELDWASYLNKGKKEELDVLVKELGDEFSAKSRSSVCKKLRKPYEQKLRKALAIKLELRI